MGGITPGRQVHFLDQRMKDLGRQTGELIAALEEHAVRWPITTLLQVRREAIYERINAEQAAELDKKREKADKSVAVRKTVDLKNSIIKLNSQIKVARRSLEEVQQKVKELGEVVERLQADVEVMASELQATEERILEAQDEREARLAAVLQMQTKAKWFEAIKQRQFKIQKRDEENAAAELSQLQETNGKVNEPFWNCESKKSFR